METRTAAQRVVADLFTSLIAEASHKYLAMMHDRELKDQLLDTQRRLIEVLGEGDPTGLVPAVVGPDMINLVYTRAQADEYGGAVRYRSMTKASYRNLRQRLRHAKKSHPWYGCTLSSSPIDDVNVEVFLEPPHPAVD